VEELRALFAHAAARASAVRDDQQIFVRYLHAQPHIASLDLARRHMFTGHREVRAMSSAVHDELTFTAFKGHQDERYGLGHGLEVSAIQVGVLHCNNLRSNSLYVATIAALRAAENMYLHGADGPDLLAALWLLWDARPRAALHLLETSLAVRRNATTARDYCSG
jgi:hypothetical protein